MQIKAVDTTQDRPCRQREFEHEQMTLRLEYARHFAKRVAVILHVAQAERDRHAIDRSANGNRIASATMVLRTPLRFAIASISSEKSAPIISTSGNFLCRTSARSPVPVARSTTDFGRQLATISAAHFRH